MKTDGNPEDIMRVVILAALISLTVIACTGPSTWPDGLDKKTALASWQGPRATEDGVLFVWKNGQPKQSLYLTGSFNAWRQADSDWKLAETAPGSWSLLRDLDPGKYMYLFVVDGRMLPDPSNTNTQPDGYGGTWSLLTVP